MSDDPGLERLRAVTVGEIEQREIVVVDHDPAWHDRFAAEKRRILDDPADEPAYVPALDRIGYHLRIRESDVYEHRMLRTGDRAVHLHVFGPRSR